MSHSMLGNKVSYAALR